MTTATATARIIIAVNEAYDTILKVVDGEVVSAWDLTSESAELFRNNSADPSLWGDGEYDDESFIGRTRIDDFGDELDDEQAENEIASLIG